MLTSQRSHFFQNTSQTFEKDSVDPSAHVFASYDETTGNWQVRRVHIKSDCESWGFSIRF